MSTKAMIRKVIKNNIKVGDLFICGNIIRVQTEIIRIDAIKGDKIKISYFTKNKTTPSPDRRPSIKPGPNEGTPWIAMPDWYSLDKLKLLPVTNEQLLEI